MGNDISYKIRYILAPLGAVYLDKVEGDIINYNKYKNYFVYNDTLDKLMSLNDYLKLYDSKIILVYGNNSEVNVIALKNIENRKMIFVYSFKKIKEIAKKIVVRKRKSKHKKHREWSTIKIKNDLKQMLFELKTQYSFSSYNDLIKHLLMCGHAEIEKENKELLETVREIFNV